jgi:beta-glucosidase
VTQKSIVLLKNDGNLLPLDKTTVKSLAVIGPNADVDISDWYGGKPPYTVTARAGITAAVGTGVNVQYALDNTGGQAVNIATGADAAIVVVGNNPTCGNTTFGSCTGGYDSKESVDRTYIDLKPEQVTLIQAVFAANPKTIVVDMSSFMQAITWVQRQCSRHCPHHPFQSGAGQRLGRRAVRRLQPGRPDLGDLVQSPD